MTTDSLEIVRCPVELRVEALAIVLCELPPSQRAEIGHTLLGVSDKTEGESLYIGMRGKELRGAAWGQRQAGNIAFFWPPQLVKGEDQQTAYLLADAVARALDAKAIDLAQTLLSAPDAETIGVLQRVGFRQITELLYLTCEAAKFPVAGPEPCEVEFQAYDEAQRARLTELIERTYADTLDCTALDGVREIDDVIQGYQATGHYSPENWLFVRSAGSDIGVLLLADHPQSRQWELMYMGLVPEFRGRGLGRQISRYAQWLARGARVERLLVAVDAANKPAVKMYLDVGFEIWERRSVFLRFPEKSARGESRGTRPKT
jgi:GNAT superfamily N-acetyltransferase